MRTASRHRAASTPRRTTRTTATASTASSTTRSRAATTASREANVYRLAQLSVNIIDQCVAQGVPFAREYGRLLDNRSFGSVHVLARYVLLLHGDHPTNASNGPRSRISSEVVIAAGPRLPERRSGAPERACEPGGRPVRRRRHDRGVSGPARRRRAARRHPRPGPPRHPTAPLATPRTRHLRHRPPRRHRASRRPRPLGAMRRPAPLHPSHRHVTDAGQASAQRSAWRACSRRRSRNSASAWTPGLVLADPQSDEMLWGRNPPPPPSPVLAAGAPPAGVGSGCPKVSPSSPLAPFATRVRSMAKWPLWMTIVGFVLGPPTVAVPIGSARSSRGLAAHVVEVRRASWPRRSRRPATGGGSTRMSHQSVELWRGSPFPLGATSGTAG